MEMECKEESLNDILRDVSDSDITNIKQYKGITKQHWQPSNYNSVCSNGECKKSFKRFLEKPHHCRRCGKLFCKKCIQYQRRLNELAKPDPNGRLYKVCKACHDQGPQSMGASRSWSRMFRSMKSGVLTSQFSRDAVTNESFRDKFDMKKECERLIVGFKENIGNSELKRTVVDVTSVFTVPEWQKSSQLAYWEMSTKCNGCRNEFGLIRKKHHCRVCGAAVCGDKTCSTKHLLVFIPNKKQKAKDHAESGDSTNSQTEVKRDSVTSVNEDDDCEDEVSTSPEIAIIKIVGCPPKEPDVCLYLRVCRLCQQTLEDLQVQRYKSEMKFKQGDPARDAWAEIIKQCDRFRELEEKIESQLPEYQDLVDYLEVGSTAHRTQAESPKRTSNTQTLAKAQSDLSDHLTQYTMMIFSLKKIKPVTNGQQFIFKNILVSKCSIYQENMFLFRESKKRLEESTPPEVLDTIQGIVDQNTINSCYVSIKQLALEVLHLCDKHTLGDELPQRLVQTETVMYEDLKREICRDPKENWEYHEACLNKLLQYQLKKERRLIKPSKRLLRSIGSEHVRDVINERCAYVIRQVNLQLEQKSAAKQYKASKAELKNLLESLDKK